jgi:hypothetical protein
MRPFRISAIALTLLAWAAVVAAPAGATPSSGGGDGTVLTFSRATASPAIARVWHVLGGRGLLDEDDEIPEDWNPGDESESGGGDGNEPDPFIDGYELPSSIPDSDFERVRILQTAGLTGAGTLRDAMQALELPFIFAGREQWVRNVTGAGVEDEPRLWDVSMQSVVHDDHAQQLLLGRTLAAAEYRSPQAAFDDLSYWQTLVPEWAPRVRDQLEARGIPFAVELLASPEINLTDPSKPLFAKGEMPSSLFQLGVLQHGENDYLRSISAEELMLEVWPDYWRYYHRPAGSPVPPDLRAGMTFGSPVLQADGTYLRSPIMSTDSYMRWLAYGYPGYTVDEDAESLMNFDPSGYGSIFYFTGGFEKFAPWNLDKATLDRFQLLLAGK